MEVDAFMLLPWIIIIVVAIIVVIVVVDRPIGKHFFLLLLPAVCSLSLFILCFSMSCHVHVTRQTMPNRSTENEKKRESSLDSRVYVRVWKRGESSIIRSHDDLVLDEKQNNQFIDFSLHSVSLPSPIRSMVMWKILNPKKEAKTQWVGISAAIEWKITMRND